MSIEEKNIQKNKIIITVTILVLIFTVVGYILLNSTLNDTLHFHYIDNQNTGVPLGLIESILLYILFWGLIGGMASSIITVFVMCLHFFLHRKDKRVFDILHPPKYVEEFYYGAKVAFIATYTAIFILMVLHISNIATINWV